MREGLPRTVVILSTCAFALALVDLMLWFRILRFLEPAPRRPGPRWGAARVVLLTAGLSGPVSLTSGMLVLHHKREPYGTGEEVIFRVCLIVSTGILLCSGPWALAILVFG
ncbi:MAG: hypothetical protein CYG60_22865 [Actinobacteria bacterium]|jgi:hypothetical protein|nr:hypothetical protein [Actinomycetota bacterium]PLS83026.1 MAG: hypothetical protein CYG60_22865 [Actinomycetota bacterium]